jgi:ATP-dependent exoDNAse (exonuclease V) beta subunit
MSTSAARKRPASVGPEPFVSVRASAGTGKTHALTTRMIRLLADGAEVGDLFAATFARKAAGEILARVLHRLASAAEPVLSASTAEPASSAATAEPASSAATAELAAAIERPGADAAFFRDLLLKVMAALDRLAVGTLDSFFVNCADATRFELGLPANWTIGTEAELESQRRRAIHGTIERAFGDDEGRSPAATMADLLMRVSGGATTTGLESLLEGVVSDLAAVHREAEPSAWDWVTVPRPPADADIDEAIAALEAATFTDKRIAEARDKDLAAFRAGEWKTFAGKGIASKVLVGEDTYYRKPIEPEVQRAYQTLLALARTAVLGMIAAQTRGMRDVLDRYVETIDELAAAEGIVSFDDVTRMVGLAAGDGTLDAARWRGISFAKHLLLDEFQDTSLSQWRVLERLAEHTATSGGSFFAVGDDKQAIYGWRGGKAELIDSLADFFDQAATPLAMLHLSESYRSSPAVLDVVNKVFDNLAGCEPLTDHAAVAARWRETFVSHAAAARNRDLPGWVRLRTAPAAQEDEKQSDVVLAHAAARAAALARANPAARIGVLVRTNHAAEQVIARLKGRENIVASAEGGNPLDDSPAVDLLLSVLTLCDHPSDSIARFHVGRSPLAAALGLDEATASAAAPPPGCIAAIDRLRRELIDDGYGPVLGRLAAIAASSGSQRDARRLEQFVESARAWDLAAGGPRVGLARTAAFIAQCRRTSVADPVPSPIRVMTIHKAKGLEFDLVVLTDLDRKLMPHAPRVVIDRAGPLAPIRRVLAAVPRELQPFLPDEWQERCEAAPQPIVREAIATLYVGLTRAIQGLEIVIAPAKENEKTVPKTLAGILRATLPDVSQAPPDAVLFTHAHHADASDDSLMAATAAKPTAEPAPAAAPIPLKPLDNGGRRRGAPLRTPSSAEGGRIMTAAALLDTGSQQAKDVGTLLHAWAEAIGWPAVIPPDDRLLAIAAQHPALATQHPALAAQHATLLADFRGMCGRPAVAAVLAEPPATLPEKFVARGIPAGPAEPRLLREHAFVLRDEQGIMQGVIDRLVIWSRDGKPIAAEVIDFKFDGVGSGAEQARLIEEKTAFYTPQLADYRRAVAQLFGLAPRCITADLVFMRPGTVVTV